MGFIEREVGGGQEAEPRTRAGGVFGEGAKNRTRVRAALKSTFNNRQMHGAEPFLAA